MEYLVRGRDRRADPRLVLAEAQSVLSVAWSYDSRPAGALDPSRGPRYARYLRANDYHMETGARLQALGTQLASAWHQKTGRVLKWKTCVDTSAVLERFWAAANGLGWIGKNSMLIHPKQGSYLFLGEMLFSEESGEGPRFLPDYCGHCTRCLEGCPTSAITAPRQLDARLCTAYFTLEKRGDFGVPPSVTSKAGPWVAGCDLCQEVCPFNQKTVKAAEISSSRPADGATSLRDWESLLAESDESYRGRTRKSALDRVRPPEFSRNLALALANAASSMTPARLQELLALIQERLERETPGPAREEWRSLYAKLKA